MSDREDTSGRKRISDREKEDVRQVFAEIARRQQRSGVRPKPISDAVNRLMARRGYAQVQSSQKWNTLWQQVAGRQMAKQSRVGRLRGNVLEIVVGNSALLQELTFQKRKLLAEMQKLAAGDTIRDLRFRVGDLA